jgi:small GTP-binding protein
MENSSKPQVFKIIVLGDSDTGKTTLLTRYYSQSFYHDSRVTIGCELRTKILEINNKKIKLQMWDTAGQEKYRYINKVYYRGACGVIITYDCTNENSFNNIKYWIEEIKANADNNICKVIAGTKCDLVNKTVDIQKAEELGRELGVKVFETSSKNDVNVDETFQQLASEILEKSAPGDLKDISKLKLQSDPSDNKRFCC